MVLQSWTESSKMKQQTHPAPLPPKKKSWMTPRKSQNAPFLPSLFAGEEVNISHLLRTNIEDNLAEYLILITHYSRLGDEIPSPCNQERMS